MAERFALKAIISLFTTIFAASAAYLAFSDGPRKVYPVNRHITLTFSKDIPEQIRDGILTGAMYWRCVGVVIDAEPGGELLPVVYGRTSDGDAFYSYDGYIGVYVDKVEAKFPYDKSLEKITVFHDYLQEVKRIFAILGAHELGHALGLDHVDGPNIMNHFGLEDPDDGKHLTANDVAQFNHRWHTNFSAKSCHDVPLVGSP